MSYRSAGRNNKGMTKHGAKGKTDAAHKLSHRVAKGIKSHTGGRPVVQGHDALARKINSDANLRIKTTHGNRILDERRDKRIVEAYKTKAPLREMTTAKRAVQAYKGAKAVGVDSLARSLGNMTFANGKKGRNKTTPSLQRTKSS